MALILLTTAYAPLALLQGWLQDVAAGQPGHRRWSKRRARASSAASPGPTPGRACWPWRACWSCSARLALREMRRTGAVVTRPAPAARPLGPSAVSWPSGSCAQNWRRGRARRARATPTPSPSPGRYPWQWYWDSCFAAIVWRRFDPRPRPGRAGEPARRPAPRRLHRPHDLLGQPGLADPARLLQRALAAAPCRPRRSSRRCSPGPGGSRSATRPRSRGSRAQMDWLAANRDLEGDGLLWIVQPDESGLDASPKFEPVWGRRANGADRLPAAGPRATAGSASTPAGCASAAARCSARPWSTRCGRSRCRRWAGPRRRRRWSSGSGTSAAASSSTRRSPAAIAPGVVDLGLAGAAGAARPAGGDRPPPGRGAPAEPEPSS